MHLFGAEPRSIAGLLFPCQYLCGTILVTPFLMVWDERMDDYRKARRVLMAEVSGGGVRGRPRLGWMDGVQVALGNRGMTV